MGCQAAQVKTRVLRVDSDRPDAARIALAADYLRAGKLVAFPTETVYGLGANALDAGAVGRIFAAKGRPANNPLIVHVAECSAARSLALDWPPAAAQLAQRFWPGPLTLVVRAVPQLPLNLRAGGPTIGLRIPAHPVARALLRAARVPVAAPSANRSMQLSPTTAAHVLASLGERIDLVLDGGPTNVGLESTVVDVTSAPVRVLRPGMIGRAELEAVLGIPVSAPSESANSESSSARVDEEPHGDVHAPFDPDADDRVLRSPGQFGRHYAPRTPLVCVIGSAEAGVAQGVAEGLKIAWVAAPDTAARALPGVRTVTLPNRPTAYAAQLYATLHELDAAGLDRIVVELPPETEEWVAVRDRLRRAAGME